MKDYYLPSRDLSETGRDVYEDAFNAERGWVLHYVKTERKPLRHGEIRHAPTGDELLVTDLVGRKTASIGLTTPSAVGSPPPIWDGDTTASFQIDGKLKNHVDLAPLLGYPGEATVEGSTKKRMLIGISAAVAALSILAGALIWRRRRLKGRGER